MTRNNPTLIMRSLLAALLLALAQPTPPPSADVLAECTRLLPPDRPIPTGPDAPTLRLLAPAAGVVLGSEVVVSIQAQNFDVTTEGRHWHLWVNGELRGMVYQPTAVIDLEPGTYTLCASLGNTDHADLGMPDGVRLTVERAGAGTPVPTLSIDREAARVIPEPGFGLPQLLLLLGGGLLAALGGWQLGRRLPRRRRS